MDADIAIAESLPPQAFRAQEVLDVELERLFTRYWTLAAPAKEPAGSSTPTLTQSISKPGARAPVTAWDAAYYLHRAKDDTLHAFPNVCTHAWHTLVKEPSHGKTVACPQHGRTFDDVGRFMHQPGIDTSLPGFPRTCDHLRRLRADTWGPLAFIHRGTPAHSLADTLAPVRASLGQLPLNGLSPIADQSAAVRTVTGNWKLHACNFLDSLHIPYIHGGGGLSAALHLDSYRTEIHDSAVLQWGYAKDPALGFDPDLLPDRFRDPTRSERRVFALWWFVYPNLTLNFYPWGLSVNAYMPVRDNPTKTRFHWLRYSWDEALSQRMEDWHMEDVDQEDVTALDQVAQGVTSPEAVRGRFAPGAEAAPHWFHRRVYEDLSSR